MAKVNKAVAPYYDDYNSDNQYTHLLAIPGRVAQAREITQIQSTMKDIVKSIGDSILKDGNVVEGCQVIIAPDKLSAKVTIGKVYINGMVLPVYDKDENGNPIDSTIAITGKGIETIGFKLMESIITEEDDRFLRDPAQGYDNFNQPGCHRIKSEVALVKDDPDAAILVTLENGEVTVEKYAPNYDALTQTLARRTQDESGSYIVEGLQVRVEKNIEDSSRFNVVVEPGKAYVLGYELNIPSARRISVPRSLTYNTVEDYALTYVDGVSNVVISNAPYVASITKVTGYRTKTQNVSAPTTNTSSTQLQEALLYTEGFYSIDGYTAGVDFRLERRGNAGYIVWLGTNKYPSTSYNITYRYTHTFIKGTDYELVHNNITDAHEISWISGTTPISNTIFYVTYEQYLARRDIVYIDQYGNIAVIEGTPAQYNFETLPSAPINTLALASISSPPGGTAESINRNTRISVSNIGLTRFTMSDIHRLLNRIKTMEYDQTVLSLNDEAKQYTTSSDKKGIFTDALIDFSKVDLTYNLLGEEPADPSLPVYNAAISGESSMCYLPTPLDVIDLIYSEDASTSAKYLNTITLPTIGEKVILEQLNATKLYNINPYSAFPGTPEISISPSSDYWIDNVTLPDITDSMQGEDIVLDGIEQRWNDTNRWWSGSYDYSRTGKSEMSEEVVDTQVDRSESTNFTDYITFIRQRDISIEGTEFSPNTDNIVCEFDGTKVSLTPLGDTESGSSLGSVKSNAEGKFKAKFRIPARIPSGVREIKVGSDVTVDDRVNSASALYQATFIRREWQKTITEITRDIVKQIRTTDRINYIDPIGQTFVLDRMTILKGIDLYFESKPTTNEPVHCEIREVVNGTITNTVYGRKTLYPVDIVTSSDSTRATRFNFEDPVLLEPDKQYAFVVRSASTSYRLWVAELGENDIRSGEPVVTNPYLIGVMLSSSNNFSWTVHQTTDVKFRLIENVYGDTAEVYFDRLNNLQEFSRIILEAESAIPQGTSIKWMYSTDNGVTYLDISTSHRVQQKELYSSIIYKAVLSNSTNNNNLSPILLKDTIGTVLSRFERSGYYISKPIRGLDEYTNVDIILDTRVHEGTSLEVYISTAPEDNEDNLIRAELVEGEETALNYGWFENTYRARLDSAATDCRIFIKMNSDYEYISPAFRRLRVIMS